MATTIKVVEDDDTFFFGPNAIIFIQHGNRQVQISFDEEGGANIVQFEPRRVDDKQQVFAWADDRDVGFATTFNNVGIEV
ncbi:hypothetical protein ACVIRO_001266 [Rhizobium ruizarguesonis]